MTGRDRRRNAQPNAAMYVGYADDDEDVESIMAKFQDIEDAKGAKGGGDGGSGDDGVSDDKELTEDFLLVVKHPAAFSAMLPTLSQHYPCFAAVRNPISVLGSWNSVAYPIHRGHIPAAD